MSSLGWARSLSSAADLLRRGAWYPILEKAEDGHVVVVEVDKKPVRVSRIDIKVRETAPDSWCVVKRTGVMRPTWGGQKILTEYAVCPHCRERQELDGTPDKMACQRCRQTSPVDWAEVAER